MAKVLYLIMNHVNPQQVLRLVRAIKDDSSESVVIIHHDYQNSKYHLDPTAFEVNKNVYVLRDTVSVQWGRFSLVQAILHCFDWVIKNSIEFDWLVLLSGQDYPIQPIRQIEEFLQNTKYDGFMEYFLAESPPTDPQEFSLRWAEDTGILRLYYHYYFLPASLPFFVNKLLFHVDRLTKWQSLIRFVAGRRGVSIGLKSLSKPFTEGFRCYAGSSWFTLSSPCVFFIYEFVQREKKLVDYYRSVLHPDESFFQTILINQKKFNIFNDNKRYTFWDTSNSANPTILKTQDFYSLTISGKHFARKFDPGIDSQILDLIDNQVLAQTSSQRVSWVWTERVN